MPAPPWILWGETKQIVMTSTAANAQRATSQIARIRYARPETWRWIWGAILVEGTFDPNTTSSTLQLVMQVTTGIGRTQFTLELGRFVFVWAGAAIPVFDPLTNLAGKKWTNNINGPPASDSAPAVLNTLDNFVGQDIQVNVLSLFTSVGGGGGIAGNVVKCDVTTLFSPNVHVRPEWHVKEGANITQFPGDEQRGSVL